MVVTGRVDTVVVVDDDGGIGGEIPANRASSATIFWHRAEISNSVLSNVFKLARARASEARELVSWLRR